MAVSRRSTRSVAMLVSGMGGKDSLLAFGSGGQQSVFTDVAGHGDLGGYNPTTPVGTQADGMAWWQISSAKKPVAMGPCVRRNGVRRSCVPDQTGLMPALAMMSRHFGTSSSMRLRMPSGPLARTSKPLLRNCSDIAGRLKISIDFVDNNSTMAGGVFAGARKPWNVSETKSL